MLYMNIKLVKPKIHSAVLQYILRLLFLFLFAIGAKAQSTENVEKASLFSKVETWYADNMNYGTITVLMAAESSIFPVPSELVVPPAAYIASRDDGHLNIFWVILFATIGALIGATVNYFVLGMWLGRSVIYKFADSRVGRMLLLSSEKLKKSEEFFNKYGKLSTFIGRFIPVIRHFISIPAGFSKMNYPAFAIFTFIGAGLWNCILALLGYMAHGQQDTINRYSHEIGYGLLVLAALLVIYFVVRYIIRKKKKQMSV